MSINRSANRHNLARIKRIVLNQPDLLNGEEFTDKELSIIKKRVIQGHTFKSIGEDYGVSHERARQIFTKCLYRLEKKVKVQ